MTSPAEQVFAIPELLEHILLYLDQDNPHMVTRSHSKELFGLQRVSRSFYSGIIGSTRLRFMMGLGFPLPADEEAVRKTGLASPYLGHVAMDVYPFTFQTIKELPMAYDGKGLVIVTLSSYIDCKADGRGRSIGFNGRKRVSYTKKHHTWRRLMATNLETTLSVKVRLMTDDYCEDDKCSALVPYTEWLHQSGTPVTLGDIADMLDTIRERSLVQHSAITIFNKQDQSHNPEPSLSHFVAEDFLRAAWMHLAWMQFDREGGAKRLEKELTSRPHFWQKSATKEFDDALEWQNECQLRALYRCDSLSISKLESFAGRELSMSEIREIRRICSDEDDIGPGVLSRLFESDEPSVEAIDAGQGVEQLMVDSSISLDASLESLEGLEQVAMEKLTAQAVVLEHSRISSSSLAQSIGVVNTLDSLGSNLKPALKKCKSTDAEALASAVSEMCREIARRKTARTAAAKPSDISKLQSIRPHKTPNLVVRQQKDVPIDCFEVFTEYAQKREQITSVDGDNKSGSDIKDTKVMAKAPDAQHESSELFRLGLNSSIGLSTRHDENMRSSAHVQAHEKACHSLPPLVLAFGDVLLVFVSAMMMCTACLALAYGCLVLVGEV